MKKICLPLVLLFLGGATIAGNWDSNSVSVSTNSLTITNTTNPSLTVQTTDNSSVCMNHFINLTAQGPFTEYRSALQRWAFGIGSDGNWKLRNSSGGTDPVNGTTVWDMSPTGALTAGGTYTNSSAGGIIAVHAITAGDGFTATTSAGATPAGTIGEFKSSSSVTMADYTTSFVFGNVVTLSLGAGDWLLTGCVTSSLNGSVMTDYEIAISSFTGNTMTDHVEGYNWMESSAIPITTANSTLCVPAYEAKLSGTTTMYLKAKAGYTGTTPQNLGTLTAHRIR